MVRSKANRRRRAPAGVLPDDLYIVPGQLPRIVRPDRHDLSTWTVTDDWPDHIPVSKIEIDVFEAWFGDLFDELIGPRR